MTRDPLIALARAAAAAHSLDPALVCAVCEQESAWNPWAIRYEPGFLARYVAPLFTAGKISATEAYSRSFSWGLMQVMGQVAREHGFGPCSPGFPNPGVSAAASLAELCDPASGLDVGCRVLAHKFAAAGAKLAAENPGTGSPQDGASSTTAACPECGQSVPGGALDMPAQGHGSPADPRVIERALQLWNGGANPGYAAQVLARVAKYV